MMRFPRWLSWIVLLGLAYILYTGNTREHGANPPRPAATTVDAPASEPRDYREIEALVDGKRWARALNPDYRDADTPCAPQAAAEGMLARYAIVAGEGMRNSEPLACGDRADLEITLYNPQGKAMPGKTVSLTLGGQPGFDWLAVGMRVDEVRIGLFATDARYEALPMLLPHRLQVVRVVSKGKILD